MTLEAIEWKDCWYHRLLSRMTIILSRKLVACRFLPVIPENCPSSCCEECLRGLFGKRKFHTVVDQTPINIQETILLSHAMRYLPLNLSCVVPLVGLWESSEVQSRKREQTGRYSSSLGGLILRVKDQSLLLSVPIDPGTSQASRTDNPKNTSKSAGKRPKYS